MCCYRLVGMELQALAERWFHAPIYYLPPPAFGSLQLLPPLGLACAFIPPLTITGVAPRGGCTGTRLQPTGPNSGAVVRAPGKGKACKKEHRSNETGLSNAGAHIFSSLDLMLCESVSESLYRSRRHSTASSSIS